MKKSHLAPCVVGVALAVAVFIALGGSASSVGFLAVVLACPLMMIVMMRMMMGGHHRDTDRRL
ncbi:MAG: DUF2933 domain-containing protein [Actinomycetota bacterium]